MLVLALVPPAAGLSPPGDVCTPDPPPDAVLLGPHAGAAFGATLAGADLDDDGWSDLVVGVPDLRGTGGIEVFRGSAGGLDPAPLVVDGIGPGEWGSDLAVAGDVDADGFPDLVVGSRDAEELWIIAGGPAGLDAAPTWVAATPHPTDPVGSQVDGGRDVDGDGIDDVVFGASHLVEGEGAWLWRGGVGGPALPVPLDLGDFAVTLLLAGDLDGDGRADPVGVGWSVIRVWPGGDPGIDVSVPAGLDRWLAIGDADGDGLEDLASLAPGDGGRLWMVHGASGSWVDPIGYVAPDPGDELFGVLAAGDLDDDGAVEVAVEVYRTYAPSDWLGWVALYEADGATFRAEPDRVFASGASRCDLGAAAVVGDIDADGAPDLALGGPAIDSLQGDGAGRVFLYYGWGEPLDTAGTSTGTTASTSAAVGPRAGAEPGCGCATGAGGGWAALAVVGWAAASIRTRRAR